MTNQPLLKAEGISKIYSQGALAVGLHRFSASFYRGEFVAITGSSGSGKSTLLNVLSGLDNYDEGELYFKGEPTSHYTEEDRAAYRKDNVAFIFQDYNILDSYTVYQNIELALIYTMPDEKARKERINALIKAVGLDGHEKQRCSKLSGGQKQRVSIARALAKDAPILFADEPCGNLDSTMTAEIMQLLHDLSADKLVIIVTHSYDEVAPYATRKIRLADGELTEDQVFRTVDAPEKDAQPCTISKKQIAKGLLTVAFNNIKATPKRSFFGLFGLTVLTTIFIVVTFLVVKLVQPDIINNDCYKYDLQVCKASLARTTDGPNTEDVITEQDIQAIKAINGVKDVFRAETTLNSTLQIYVKHGDSLSDFDATLTARPSFNITSALYSGRLPENLNEVVLSLPASRKYFKQVKTGDVVVVRNYFAYNYTDDTILDEEYTVVGIVLDDTGCAYFVSDYFKNPTYYYQGTSETNVTVACANNADLDRIRDKLSDMGYVAFHLYGDHPMEDLGVFYKFLTVVGMFFGILILFRIITGSYRALEANKRVDYNIMRTVGLPNSFVKSIYYVEMALQGLIGWAAGVSLGVVVGLIYGIAITPSIGYGFKMIAGSIGDLAWIVSLILVIDLVVTLGNAVRFNRYFYRQTVKKSLKEAAQHD